MYTQRLGWGSLGSTWPLEPYKLQLEFKGKKAIASVYVEFSSLINTKIKTHGQRPTSHFLLQTTMIQT